MKNYKFSVVVEKERMGFYAACPALPGCYSRGKTLEEALRSMREAIKVHLENRMSDDEEIPQPEPVSFTRLDVSF